MQVRRTWPGGSEPGARSHRGRTGSLRHTGRCPASTCVRSMPDGGPVRTHIPIGRGCMAEAVAEAVEPVEAALSSGRVRAGGRVGVSALGGSPCAQLSLVGHHCTGEECGEVHRRGAREVHARCRRGAGRRRAAQCVGWSQGAHDSARAAPAPPWCPRPRSWCPPPSPPPNLSHAPTRAAGGRGGWAALASALRTRGAARRRGRRPPLSCAISAGPRGPRAGSCGAALGGWHGPRGRPLHRHRTR